MLQIGVAIDILHCLPSELDDVPTHELMEILDYRHWQEAQRKIKEAEEKEELAKKSLDALVAAENKEKSELAKGPAVIGKEIK